MYQYNHFVIHPYGVIRGRRMKKIVTIAIAMAMLLASVTMVASVAKADNGFEFTSPLDGDRWYEGTTHTVTWTYAAIGTLWDHTSIRLNHVNYGGSIEIFSTSDITDTTFSWDIPDDLDYWGDYEINMVLVLTDGSTETVDTVNFIIVQKSGVSYVSPADGTTDVSVTTAIDVYINVGIGETGPLPLGGFSLSAGGVSVPGTSEQIIDHFTFYPGEVLQYSTEYTISVTSSDRWYPFSSTFVTHASDTPPTVIEVTPGDGYTDVSPFTGISMRFSESMDKASVEQAFILSYGAGNVQGTFNWGGDDLYGSSWCHFDPSTNLQQSIEYTITIGVGAEDFAGNAMASAFTSRFTTGVNNQIPTIYDTTPSTPITLYTDGTSIDQNFYAAFEDDEEVVTAGFYLDSSPYWIANFPGIAWVSVLIEVPLGQHTIMVIAIDNDGFVAEYAWSVNVITDTIAPAISGFIPNQNIKNAQQTPWVKASFSDEASGVNVNSVKVFVDGKDLTINAKITSSGMMYPTALLSKGTHLFYVEVMDNAGYLATQSWFVKVAQSYRK
jgi:hypothetical protein